MDVSITYSPLDLKLGYRGLVYGTTGVASWSTYNWVTDAGDFMVTDVGDNLVFKVNEGTLLPLAITVQDKDLALTFRSN